jgi:L-iditol 2-dehydrogenase
VLVAEGRIAGPRALILGHEFSGVIVDAGEATRFVAGDRVVVNPAFSCGLCPTCQAGRASACPRTQFLGVDLDGAFAEFIRVPAAAVFQLPDQVSFFGGVFFEPLAACLAVFKAGIQPHESGLVLGHNRIASLLTRLLRSRGFDNIVSHEMSSRDRLESDAFDFAIETAATTATLAELVRVVRPQGKIVLKSRQYHEAAIIPAAVVRKELIFHAVNYGSFEEALAWITSAGDTLDDLVGEVFSLAEFDRALLLAKDDESRKIFFQVADV